MSESEGSRTWLVLLGLAAGLLVVVGVGSLLGGGPEVYIPLFFGLVAVVVGAYFGRQFGRKQMDE